MRICPLELSSVPEEVCCLLILLHITIFYFIIIDFIIINIWRQLLSRAGCRQARTHQIGLVVSAAVVGGQVVAVALQAVVLRYLLALDC